MGRKALLRSEGLLWILQWESNRRGARGEIGVSTPLGMRFGEGTNKVPSQMAGGHPPDSIDLHSNQFEPGKLAQEP
jgi:hypothetical protein